MRPILVQFARLATALVAIYGFLLLLTLTLRPATQGPAPLDSAQAGSSLYLTEPKYVFFSRSRLNTATDKVLVLGASNTLVGFKQRELQAALPEREVHNISVSGSNITQLRQVAQLVRDVQGPEARRGNTFVLGLWYGVFADDRARWHTPDRHPGDTDIDLERYRYGFYRRSSAGAVPLLAADALDLGARLVHPYLVLDELARDATRPFRERLSGKPARLSDEQRNQRTVSAAEQPGYLAFWRHYMGDRDELSDAPFQTLRELVGELSADGAQVVLVDMPIPAWHERGSPLHADYERRLTQMLPELGAHQGVSLLRIPEDDNDDFSDEVHPKPRVTERWSRELARALRSSFNQREQHEHRSTLRQADAGISRRIR